MITILTQAHWVCRKGDKGSINPPIHVDMDLTRLGRWGPDQGNFGLNSDSDGLRNSNAVRGGVVGRGAATAVTL